MCLADTFRPWMAPGTFSLDISTFSITVVIKLTSWLPFSWTWKLHRNLLIKRNKHNDLSWNNEMQDEEKAFWHIELVAHCVCWSTESCRLWIYNISTVIIGDDGQTIKQNHSLGFHRAAQCFCKMTKITLENFKELLLYQWNRSMLHTCCWPCSQPS